MDRLAQTIIGRGHDVDVKIIDINTSAMCIWKLEMLAAFCNAVRSTLVGTMTPSLTRSP